MSTDEAPTTSHGRGLAIGTGAAGLLAGVLTIVLMKITPVADCPSGFANLLPAQAVVGFAGGVVGFLSLLVLLVALVPGDHTVAAGIGLVLVVLAGVVVVGALAVRHSPPTAQACTFTF